MTCAQWRFRQMAPTEINQGTVVREFFEDEPINTRLVREAIQNSLDAAIDTSDDNGASGPVRVRFSLAGIHNPLPAERAARYFAGLPPHLAQITELDADVKRRAAEGNLPSSHVPYLVVEDAGTKGLGGDWQVYDTEDQDNHFYWFFRNIGISGKGDSDNGSWGLGKWVFPDASRISAYLAVTRRSQDDETLLMGQAVLAKHSIGGQRHDPVGYFATAGDESQPRLPLRMSDAEQRPFIDECIADFGLKWRDAPGLSVIIPFPRISAGNPAQDGDEDAGISRNQLLAEVVHNYFYPIIAGQLEVVVDAGDGSAEVALNSDTIDDVIDRLALPAAGERSRESYQRLFAMCRHSIGRPAHEHETLEANRLNQSDGYHKDQRAIWRSRYEAGELLSFRIGMQVQRKDETSQRHTSLRVYLQRDLDLAEGHDYYVRGTLSIHGNMDLIRRHRGARLLLVADKDQAIAALLRDSEPPAHTAWRPRTSRVTARWHRPQVSVNAVRNAPGQLLALLEPPTEGLQRDAFTDIFFWDGNDRPADNGRMQERKSGYTPPKPTIQRTPPLFNIAKSDGGFRLSLSERAMDNPPRCARLRVAYGVARGNPLSRYSPEDFRLHGRDALSHSIGGCEVVTRNLAGNELLLNIDDPAEFAFAVSGFDSQRDVYVRIDQVGDGDREGDNAGTTV